MSREPQRERRTRIDIATSEEQMEAFRLAAEACKRISDALARQHAQAFNRIRVAHLGDGFWHIHYEDDIAESHGDVEDVFV